MQNLKLPKPKKAYVIVKNETMKINAYDVFPDSDVEISDDETMFEVEIKAVKKIK